MVVAATRVTAVAAVVLTVERRVSLMVIALSALMATPRHAPTQHQVSKRIRVPKRRQARTQVALSNRRVHLMVATTAVTTMIAPRVLAVMLVTTVAATLVAVKIVVQRLLIVVVRTRALALRVVTLHHARMKDVKSVVHSAVIAHTLALPLVMATVMIARRARSVTAIHVRLLIAHHVLTRIAAIASNAVSAHRLHAANTRHVHARSVRSHSSVQSVPNTRHVQRVRSSMKLVHHVTLSVPLVRRQRPRPMVAIALLAAQPSRLNMRLQ